MNTYEEKKITGDQGEAKVASFFEQQGYIVEDVSNNPAYYDKGDLQVSDMMGNTFMVEVKTDTYIANTNNLCLELQNDKFNPRQNKGWFYKSTADTLAVYIPQTSEVIMLKFQELRDAYPQLPKNTMTRRQIERTCSYTYEKFVEIALIPLDAVETFCPSYKRFTI